MGVYLSVGFMILLYLCLGFISYPVFRFFSFSSSQLLCISCSCSRLGSRSERGLCCWSVFSACNSNLGFLACLSYVYITVCPFAFVS